MTLSESDVELFYDLYRKLLFFVNQQHKVIGSLDSVEKLVTAPIEEVHKLRDVLYKMPSLVNSYVKHNPHGLDANRLAIVHKWSSMITGNFYIVRFLKKYTIFIQGSDVYAVHSLQDDIKEILGHGRPPIVVSAMLLPFKGKIIFDGVLGIYSITMGSGLRRRFDEMYKRAKNRGEIIETLEPQSAPPKPVKKKTKEDVTTQTSEHVEQIANLAKKLKGATTVQKAVFTVLKVAAALAQSAIQDPEDYWSHTQELKKVRRAYNKLQNLLTDLTEDF